MIFLAFFEDNDFKFYFCNHFNTGCLGLRSFFISLICIFLTNHIIGQSLPYKKNNPLSNSFATTIEVGSTIPRTDYKIDELSIIGRLMVEYFFELNSNSALGIKILGSGGILKGQIFSNELIYPPASETFNTDFYSIGTGVTYALYFQIFTPYFSASTSLASFNPGDENGYKLPNNQFSIYNNSAMLYTLETGIRFPFSQNWSLNLGLNYNFSDTDYLDDIKAGYNNDGLISFFTGLSFYFGNEIDTDRDGIADDFDLCPDTPIGKEVNEFGCSDSDLRSQETSYDSLKDYFILDGIFSDGKLYCLQVDVFQQLAKAEELQNKILTVGYKADIFTTKFGGRIWYSVRIGYFNSFETIKFFRDNFFKTSKLKLK